MALVIGGFLHYTDMRKSLKNLRLRKRWSDIEIISQKCSLGDPLKKGSRNFDLSINMALVNGGYTHCTDIRNSCKFFSESDPPPPKKKKKWLWPS